MLRTPPKKEVPPATTTTTIMYLGPITGNHRLRPQGNCVSVKSRLLAVRTQTRLRPCRDSFPSLSKTAVFRYCNDLSQCEHSFACDPAGAIFRPAQDAVFRLCNDFSQCGHRPACDPAGAVYRLAQDNCTQVLQRLLARASACSPAALPEQFNVLLRTASPSHIPPPHPTHPPHPLGVGQAHRRCAHPRVCTVDLYFLTG